jgi:hypothetical protein
MVFVFLLTLIFWLPGCLVAFIMTLNYNRERRR